MNHLEIEYKTLLSKTAFDNLQPLFKQAPLVQQTNYYIDSPDFSLREHKMALRIRTYENRAELTLKIPKTVGNMEYNQLMSLEEGENLLQTFSLPAGEIKSILEQENIALSSLEILGSLTTLRREMALPIGLLALDESQYLGTTDYELEMEVSDAEKGEQDFMDFLHTHGISYQAAPSKIARFAQKLAK
ncbi:CYTH domain-containing protein [Streptococcus himalayensis]|uniref:Adenylate cyclase n=1 Tax=Streptococcus himalayensis TaxID=1888195 RepID=A0A917A9M5_9STRE|nr:CYTH domain-containing protein [Streptococcus himalayensis]GGE33267.1 adenylate cyclase [Streptococcus himalayensis]